MLTASSPEEAFPLVMIVQSDPLQRMVSVCNSAFPTAHTSLGDTTATAFKLTSLPPTLGLDTNDHWLPSQWAISVCPPGLVYAPTAHTSLGDTAATPSNFPPP